MADPLTPLQYKALYENLKVPVAAGGNPVPVILNKYRLTSLNFKEHAYDAFLDHIRHHAPHMVLRADGGVDIGDPEVDAAGKPKKPDAAQLKVQQQVLRYGQLAYHGKAAPEQCLVVLQLIDHWGLNTGTLQDYADDNLGLDCNGFVGNYLCHVKHATPADWTDPCDAEHEGPNQTIDNFFDGHMTFVTKWADIDQNKMYLFGQADAHGRIIAKDGHITITEPHRFRVASGSTPSGVRSVESTAGHAGNGLVDSWYSLTSTAQKGGKTVFTINREDMMAGHDSVNFLIALVG